MKVEYSGRKLRKRTFITQEERNVHGFKVRQDRLKLLLGVNAPGDV